MNRYLIKFVCENSKGEIIHGSVNLSSTKNINEGIPAVIAEETFIILPHMIKMVKQIT